MATVARNFQDCKLLIYLTNQDIGPEADEIEKKHRVDSGVNLHIWDQAWFLDRGAKSQGSIEAFEYLVSRVAEPLLSARLGGFDTSPLTEEQEHAALLFLTLQRRDQVQERSLTKLSFESLVLAVLRGTDIEIRKSRDEVRAEIAQLLPSHDPEVLNLHIDSALDRLKKSRVRYRDSLDEFNLSREERDRIRDGRASLENERRGFVAQLHHEMADAARVLGVELGIADTDDLEIRVRRVLERFLLERGEAFARSVVTGDPLEFSYDELESLSTSDLAEHSSTSAVRMALPKLVAGTVERLLQVSVPAVSSHLASIADAYTLFAFLRETPNVQRATTKIFGAAEIWLDSSLVLPALADAFAPADEERRYTAMLRAARNYGCKLYVTDRIVDEILSHLQTCLRAHRGRQAWSGATPYLLLQYVQAGCDPAAFVTRLEEFRGNRDPHLDLCEYLKQVLGISVANHDDVLDELPESLRWQAQQEWTIAHSERRSEISIELAESLGRTDYENFLGVVARRRRTSRSEHYGHRAWWLTTDSSAERVRSALADALPHEKLESPVLDAHFLVSIVNIAPHGTRPRRPAPLWLDDAMVDVTPAELLSLAEEVRTANHEAPQFLVQRRLRDLLDEMRQGSERITTVDALIADIRT